MTNPNKDNANALVEMGNAQRNLAEAFDLMTQLATKVQASYTAFESANATSVNRNHGCYQEIQRKIGDGYAKLFDAIKGMNEAFGDEMLTRMIVAARTANHSDNH